MSVAGSGVKIFTMGVSGEVPSYFTFETLSQRVVKLIQRANHILLKEGSFA